MTSPAPAGSAPSAMFSAGGGDRPARPATRWARPRPFVPERSRHAAESSWRSRPERCGAASAPVSRPADQSIGGRLDLRFPDMRVVEDHGDLEVPEQPCDRGDGWGCPAARPGWQRWAGHVAQDIGATRRQVRRSRRARDCRRSASCLVVDAIAQPPVTLISLIGVSSRQPRGLIAPLRRRCSSTRDSSLDLKPPGGDIPE